MCPPGLMCTPVLVLPETRATLVIWSPKTKKKHEMASGFSLAITGDDL